MAVTRNTHLDSQQPHVSDEVVAKVGAAVGRVAMIRHEFNERLQQAGTDDERDQLADEARQAAVQAIDEQGLSLDDFNDVVRAAEDNPDLEDRLIMAARSAG